MRECPDRVDADLARFYGFTWHDVETGRVPLVSAANCVAHVPRGGAIGEWIGGALAVTAEVEAVMNLTYVSMMAASDKPKKVKRPEFPAGVREQRRREAYAVSRAEAIRRKHKGA